MSRYTKISVAGLKGLLINFLMALLFQRFQTFNGLTGEWELGFNGQFVFTLVSIVYGYFWGLLSGRFVSSRAVKIICLGCFGFYILCFTSLLIHALNGNDGWRQTAIVWSPFLAILVTLQELPAAFMFLATSSLLLYRWTDT